MAEVGSAIAGGGVGVAGVGPVGAGAGVGVVGVGAGAGVGVSGVGVGVDSSVGVCWLLRWLSADCVVVGVAWSSLPLLAGVGATAVIVCWGGDGSGIDSGGGRCGASSMGGGGLAYS